MNQPPQKEHSRPSDIAKRRSKDSHSKKTQNVPKKNLNAAFRELQVEFSPEITKELDNLSAVSEVTGSNCDTDIAHNLELALDRSLSASSEPLILYDVTPSSTVTDLLPDHHRFNSSKLGSAEADVAVRFLEQARRQVSKSADVDTLSKRLLDSLITTVVDELSHSAPAKRDDDGLSELILMKTRVVLACFLIWMLVAVTIIFLSSGSEPSYVGPPPT